MPMTCPTRTARLIAAALLVLCIGQPATAAAPHDHHAGAEHGLAFDNGRKWPTDAPLRSAMTRIRDDIDASLHAIHRNRLDKARYDALAATVEAQVADIVANCRLAPEADAQLHLIIARLLDGASAMAGRQSGVPRRQGAIRVIGALQDYGTYFDDPGWQPPGK